MRAHLSRRYRISASHRLYSDALTPEQNRALYGKCSNPHGHGHNYVIQVTVSGQVDRRTGMICDLAALDGCVERQVIRRFDHANLNLVEDFAGLPPTTENLCQTIFALLVEGVAGAKLERVRIEETSNNFFEYAGEEYAGEKNV